jgi:hypothetical protein
VILVPSSWNDSERLIHWSARGWSEGDNHVGPFRDRRSTGNLHLSIYFIQLRPWTLLIAEASLLVQSGQFSAWDTNPGARGPSLSDHIPVGHYIRFVNPRPSSSHLSDSLVTRHVTTPGSPHWCASSILRNLRGSPAIPPAFTLFPLDG